MISMFQQNCILREYACPVRSLLGSLDSGFVHHSVVARSDLARRFFLPTESIKFLQKHRALDTVHTCANANTGMYISLPLAMHAAFGNLCEIIVIGENGTAIAVAPAACFGKNLCSLSSKDCNLRPLYVAPGFAPHPL